jgi:anti-sigma factor RsiW
VSILIGGFVSLAVKRLARKRADEEAAGHRGILFGSGLIAGEAVAAIIIAFLLVGLGKDEAGKSRLPVEILNNWAVSLLIFAAAIAVMMYVALRSRPTKGSGEKKN